MDKSKECYAAPGKKMAKKGGKKYSQEMKDEANKKAKEAFWGRRGFKMP